MLAWREEEQTVTREEAARRFAEKAEDHYYVPKLREMYQMAAEALSEEPRKAGRWERYPSAFDRKCSVCGVEIDFLRNPMIKDCKYCPNCGAKMEVEE